jgi:hypothetical protein
MVALLACSRFSINILELLGGIQETVSGVFYMEVFETASPLHSRGIL